MAFGDWQDRLEAVARKYGVFADAAPPTHQPIASPRAQPQERSLRVVRPLTRRKMAARTGFSYRADPCMD